MDSIGGEMSGQSAPDRELAELRRHATQLEEELARVHRLATLGTLAGSVAHEFNNILTPVLSYAQLAMASPDDDELASKALRKAVEGTERAAKIASSMLGFIRDDDNERIASVAEVVQDTLGCLARDPAKDGIKVRVEVASGLDVSMTPVALQQVLLNLVLNAIEAIKPGQGQIEIAARPVDGSTWNKQDGSAPPIEIRIADTGSGIPPEIRDRLFEPLVSGPVREGSRQGTGLGLSICRRLIGESQGTIEAESQVDQGTTFLIRLPAAQEKSESTQRAA